MSQYVGLWDGSAPDELSARCGWCAHDVQMRRLGQSVELSRSDYGRGMELVSIAAPYVCTRYECHRLTLIRLSLTYPRVGGGNITMVGISSLPQGQAQPMDGLPGDVQADRLEAWSCFHAGNIRAAIIMGRAAIQRAVRSLGGEGDSLKTELAALRELGKITEQMRSWGDEVRIADNDAAHPEDLAEIKQDEAAESLEFMDAFLEHALALPARQLAREEARRSGGQSRSGEGGPA
jgi:hypothetical protein